jgi:hypothetical protein
MINNELMFDEWEDEEEFDDLPANKEDRDDEFGGDEEE